MKVQQTRLSSWLFHRQAHLPVASACWPDLCSRAKKEPQCQKLTRTAPKTFLNTSRVLSNITRALRQIAPENSPESSGKSLSHKFFGVPFLSLICSLVSRVHIVCVMFCCSLSACPPQGCLGPEGRQSPTPRKALERVSLTGMFG